LGELVGESPAMQEIFSLIRQIASSSASVLITGESGTGKELVARAIHQLSPRSDAPFVAVNCAALPETLIESELFGHEKGAFTGAVERRAGCFEQAQGGTLLLDEIGEMPIATQAKLLRVLEESKVRRLGGRVDIPISVRVLAATNQQPEKAIKDNRMREDLYYRLNVFQLLLPPLRERRSDIPGIANSMIGNLNKKHGCRVTHLAADVLTRLSEHSWPGNVRELRNAIERAIIVAGEGEVQLRHLPSMFATASATAQPAAAAKADQNETLQVRIGDSLNDVEMAYLRLVLRYTNNNKTRAAHILGLSVRTLHNKLSAYAAADAAAELKSSTASSGKE
jgi:DNA-binding NtrC family response regulator